MRKYVLLLILLLSIQSSIAASVQHGEIILTVINKPPTITEIKILPGEPYYDDVLECHTEIDDESPDKISFEYLWYVNGELEEETSLFFSQHSEGDDVVCIATPTDQHGLRGQSKSAASKINTAPLHVKAVKPALNMAGIEVSAKEITESTTMSAITGMATGYRESNSITLFFMLTIFTLILISINVFGLLIKLRRKSRSPKQGYQNA